MGSLYRQFDYQAVSRSLWLGRRSNATTVNNGQRLRFQRLYCMSIVGALLITSSMSTSSSFSPFLLGMLTHQSRLHCPSLTAKSYPSLSCEEISTPTVPDSVTDIIFLWFPSWRDKVSRTRFSSSWSLWTTHL
ncbi:hypothetical protein BDV06DRAFT_205895 [Aspergillus oleicola]